MMNIIFGSEQAKQIGEKYVVLELDTFQFGVDGPVETAYCVVDNVPFDQIPEIPTLKEAHIQMIEKYKTREWYGSKELTEELYGKWNGELDTFYDEMIKRLEENASSEPSENWSHVIIKDAS